jgi:uncharacterized membrane protein
MFTGIFKTILNIYRKVTTSIAFVPGLIALAMLSLSLVMIELDFSDTGKRIKSNLHWLSLKDASTARIICSTIAGGIFSLTVFSFSMVMILLSQAASQMSNRILGKLIRNRFQQIVLGFYIGTILYALFLLSTIRDLDTGVHVPAISAYLLISLTIVDIFLFIYFLHYVTESVKFDTIIHRIFKDTEKGLKAACTVKGNQSLTSPLEKGHVVKAFESGSYEGFHRDKLLSLCKQYNISVSLVYPVRTFMIRDATTLLSFEGGGNLPERFNEELHAVIDIGRTHDVATSYYYGFKQLMEIGIKALSPGINDPGTCILSLQALGELLSYRLTHSPQNVFKDDDGNVRIRTVDKSFDEIFNEHILPIWDYSKNDRLVQNELVHILNQLQTLGSSVAVDNLLVKCKQQIITISYETE